MRKRAALGVVVAGLLLAFAAVSGADIVSTSGTGTAVATPTPSSAVARPARPASPALPAEPDGSSVGGDPTLGLQRELGELDVHRLSHDERRDVKQDIADDLDDVEVTLDELDADLDEQADVLSDIEHDNGVEGSDELEAAESKLESLTRELDGLDARFFDIRLRADRAVRDDDTSDSELQALLADVRDLGSGLEAMDAKIDELDILVSAAEDRSRERDRRDDRSD